MGINLRGQGVHARLEQQLLVLLEVHFDARVVPDLHRHGDGHHGGEQDQREHPAAPDVKIKEPLRLGGMSERLTRQLQDNEQAPSGSISQLTFFPRTSRTTKRGMLINVKGPSFQISSVFGMAWRISPPTSPAVAATGIESHSW